MRLNSRLLLDYEVDDFNEQLTRDAEEHRQEEWWALEDEENGVHESNHDDDAREDEENGVNESNHDDDASESEDSDWEHDSGGSDDDDGKPHSNGSVGNNNGQAASSADEIDQLRKASMVEDFEADGFAMEQPVDGLELQNTVEYYTSQYYESYGGVRFENISDLGTDFDTEPNGNCAFEASLRLFHHYGVAGFGGMSENGLNKLLDHMTQFRRCVYHYLRMNWTKFKGHHGAERILQNPDGSVLFHYKGSKESILEGVEAGGRLFERNVDFDSGARTKHWFNVQAHLPLLASMSERTMASYHESCSPSDPRTTTIAAYDKSIGMVTLHLTQGQWVTPPMDALILYHTGNHYRYIPRQPLSSSSLGTPRTQESPSTPPPSTPRTQESPSTPPPSQDQGSDLTPNDRISDITSNALARTPGLINNNYFKEWHDVDGRTYAEFNEVTKRFVVKIPRSEIVGKIIVSMQGDEVSGIEFSPLWKDRSKFILEAFKNEGSIPHHIILYHIGTRINILPKDRNAEGRRGRTASHDLAVIFDGTCDHNKPRDKAHKLKPKSERCNTRYLGGMTMEQAVALGTNSSECISQVYRTA